MFESIFSHAVRLFYVHKINFSTQNSVMFRLNNHDQTAWMHSLN